MQARIVLIYLAIVCHGDWNLEKNCLTKRQHPDGTPLPEEEEMEDVNSSYRIVWGYTNHLQSHHPERAGTCFKKERS